MYCYYVAGVTVAGVRTVEGESPLALLVLRGVEVELSQNSTKLSIHVGLLLGASALASQCYGRVTYVRAE